MACGYGIVVSLLTFNSDGPFRIPLRFIVFLHILFKWANPGYFSLYFCSFQTTLLQRKNYKRASCKLNHHHGPSTYKVVWREFKKLRRVSSSSYLAVKQPHVWLVLIEVHLTLGTDLPLQRPEPGEAFKAGASRQDLPVDKLKLWRETLRSVGAVLQSAEDNHIISKYWRPISTSFLFILIPFSF